MKWFEIIIKTNDDAQEAIANILHESQVQGLVIEDINDIYRLNKDESLWDYIDDDIAENYYDGIVIKGYFPGTDESLDKIEKIKELIYSLSDYGINLEKCEILTNEFEDRDWNEEWKKNFKPIRVGKNFIIKPTWEKYDADKGDIIIEIDPGLAFGTGTHETTSLCIEEIEKYICSGNEVLDIGTGTGILAIAAFKCGAASVNGIDIDDNCIKASKENVRLNNCEKEVKIYKGDLVKDYSGKNDIVIANIAATVIIELIEEIKKNLKNEGIFITSGILTKDADRINKELEKNDFQIIETRIKGEWVCITSKRK